VSHVASDPQVRTRFLDPIAARERAEALQRKGKTLSEIAEEMDCRREAIVHMLYWEKVCDA
jgi:orotate phosphoribosyltransferase-like protein